MLHSLLTLLFHYTPIAGKAEIADVIKDGYSLFLIFKNKPSLFQYVYLFSEGDGLLSIFHIKKKRPTLVRWSCDEKRGGICLCKGTAFIWNKQTFLKKKAVRTSF